MVGLVCGVPFDLDTDPQPTEPQAISPWVARAISAKFPFLLLVLVSVGFVFLLHSRWQRRSAVPGLLHRHVELAVLCPLVLGRIPAGLQGSLCPQFSGYLFEASAHLALT